MSDNFETCDACEIKQVEKKKPKRESMKDRQTNYIRRCGRNEAQDIYSDIIEENTKLRKELEKARQLITNLQREGEELRNGLLQDRFMAFLESTN